MQVFQMIVFFALWSLTLAQTWNYTLGGADWVGKFCDDISNKFQSPIDIELSSCECNDKMNLELNFVEGVASPANLTLKGSPQSFGADLKPSFAHLYLKTNHGKSKLFKSSRMIFRTPSEHLIDGQSYPLELQIQFKSAFDETLGLSILYEISDKNLTNIIFADYLSAVVGSPALTTAKPSKPINFDGYMNYDKLLPDNIDFFQYNGTRTDTECGSQWNWVVLTTPFYVQQKDVDLFSQALTNTTKVATNARMQQDLNDRTIYVSSANCSDFFSNVLWFSFLYGAVIFLVFRML
jgi:carbonic anhydrase